MARNGVPDNSTNDVEALGASKNHSRQKSSKRSGDNSGPRAMRWRTTGIIRGRCSFPSAEPAHSVDRNTSGERAPARDCVLKTLERGCWITRIRSSWAAPSSPDTPPPSRRSLTEATDFRNAPMLPASGFFLWQQSGRGELSTGCGSSATAKKAAVQRNTTANLGFKA